MYFHFNLLKAAIAAHQRLADNVGVAISFETEIVIQVDAALDDLAAAPTFDVEGVIAFLGFSGRNTE